ncbi:protein AHNAK2-like isoform X1 [Hippocampus zosterae]|uniref:protein AHNAK2-like isoform X1 n=1 Tax=Hippocampus zosterae TaxID=109293 RepID=UPI00223CF071|nr:protein AHNAK2-like isoform X1 [Hippocampus zosterae]
MCDCFHLAFPNWHGAPAGTGAERRLRAPDLSSEDRSACDEPSQFTEGERPRPQGSSPVEDHPETEKYSDSDKEEDDPHHKRGSRKKGKKSAFGCGFDRRSTPKMSKLKEAYSPESGMIVKTAKDGGAEGLVYGGGGKEGIFIKEVVPESPASKSLQLKEGDQLLSATVYFDNVSYQDAIQILEHAQAYKVKLCLKRKPDITETEPLAESDIIPEDETFTPEMREHGKSKRRGDARISWPKFPSLGRGKKSRFARSHSSSEADEQRKLELSPPTSDTESPIKTQDALKGKKRHKMKLPSLTKRGRISSSEDQDTDEPTACAQEAAELISPEGLQSPMERRPGVHRIEQVALVEGSDARVTKPLAIQHKVELIAIDSALKTTDLTVALAGQDSPTGPLSPDGKKKKKERSELKMKMTGKDKSNKKEANAKSPKRLKTLGASLETAAKGDQPEHTSQTEQTSPLKGKGKTKIRTLLPKREDIEIPGMEDTGRTKVKGLHDELPETVQLSIDVDSVKEAVSKLPGYKLPKVDMCGVLIPEEITVIDANAQRISVKTPTKVADGRMKQEAPISKAEDTSTPELSKTSFKLPKIKPSDLTPEEVLTVTQMDQTTTETTQVCEPALNSKESDKISKTTKIGLPTIGFSKADFRMPDVGMYFAKPNISGPKDYTGKGERTIFLQEQLGDGGITSDAKMYKAERSAVRSTGELKYIDSEESPVEREVDFTIPEITGPQVNENFFKNELDVKKPEPESEAQLKEAWVVDLGPVKAQASSHKDKTPEAKVDSPRKDLAVNISAPSVDIEGSVMDMKIDAEQGGKGGKFKMPHLSFSIPKVKGRKTDSGWSKKGSGVTMPEAKVAVQMPDTPKIYTSEAKAEVKHAKTSESPELKIEAKIPELATDIKVKGPKSEAQASSLEESPSKFKFPTLKLPKFGMALPQVDLEMDKDVKVDQVNVKSPELKADAKIPELATAIDVKVKSPKSEVQVSSLEESPSQFKFPTLKLPKFGMALPQVDLEMDKDVKVDQVNVKSPGLKVEAKIPELATDIDVKVKGPKSEAQASSLEESPSQFKFPTLKLPKFGIALPQVDLEMDKDVKVDQVNIKSPGLKVEAKIPELATAIDVKVKSPKSEAQASSLEESPSQFKFPTLKLPKFGMALPQVDLEMGKHVKVDVAGLKSPEVKVEAEIPEPATDIDVTVKKSRFSFPKFSLTKQSSKESEVDIGLPDIDVSIPEGKMQITSPKVEFQPPEVDVNIDGPESKFKMPKFGISMPKMKGPDIDFNLSKKEGDIKLPEPEVELPDVDVQLPSVQVDIEARPGSVEGSPSKFKLPTIKLPKLGVALPQVNVGVPDMETDIKVDGAGLKSPEVKVEAEIPEPATDIDVTVKKSRFSFPKFSLTKQSSKESEVDIGLPDIDVSIPEGKMQITSPKVEFQPPEVDVNIDGQESKFKMPKFGISMPKMKGPDIDFSLSRKEGEIKLPETEVELPDVDVNLPSVQVDIEAPKIEARPGSVEGSPSKFKLPTIKLPKLGVALPQVSVGVPDMDTDIKVDGAGLKSPDVKVEAEIPEPATDIDVTVKKSRFSFPKFSLTKQSSKESEVDIGLPDVDVSIPEGKMQITSPKVEFQPPEVNVNIDGPESKFKMPKFGISMPKMKGPDIDFSSSRKEGEIKLPETEVELPDVDVKLQSVQVDIEAPKIEARPGSVEGSPSKFKLPTIKLPKFGVALPQVSVGVPDMDTDIKVDGAGLKSPEVKVEAEIPEPATDIDVTVKKSRFSFPKFSLTKQSSKESEVDIGLPDVDGSIPEGKMQITSPKVEFQPPEVDVNIDGQESKFKMPKFGISMPKMKGPDIDFSLSRKEGEIKLPETEVELPDVDVKLTSVQVDIEAPKIEARPGSVEGSPSKFKLPTIKLPKLGVALPQVSVEVPDMDRDIKVDGTGLKSPEVKVEADIPEPATDIDVKVKKSRFSFPKFSLTKQSSKESEVDIGLPDVDVSIPEGKMQMTSPKVEFQPPEVDLNIDGPERKFKMPKFGISVPKMKGPDIDFSLSNKEGDIKLPQTEVELPEVDVNLPSVQVDIEAPKIEARPGSVEGSPSKFKLPTIKLPKLGVALPQVNVEVPVMDADIKVDGAGLKSPEVKVEAEIPDPATELDVKVKKSSFSFPKFSFTKQSSKESEVEIGLPDVDVSIPEGKMQIISPKVEFQQPKLDVNAHGDLKLPDSKITLPSAEDEIEVTKIEGPKSRVEGSPTKFKLPPFNLPTFGGSPSRVGVEVPYVDKDTESDAIKPEISEEEANQVLSTTSIDIEGQSVEVTTQGDELQGSGIKVKPVPDVDAEIKLPDVEGKQLEGTVSVPQAPKVEGDVRLSKGTGNVDVSPVSPSKFKLPSFKMPRLAFSRNKPEGQSVSPDTEYKDSRPEMKAELSGDGKSPQATSASFGVVLENLDVEFELPKSEKGEGHPETPKEEMERKDKQTKQEATKSPERTGWFRFPTFGLSSPSEPAKTPIKNDEKDKKSPFGEREEDMSPTCSARSSDIYADISSTATSEYLSLHSSSPTKVTVKYSNQNLPPDLGEMNILTSTAMSELITIEPNLPEKITILSSEVLSSSEETLRLASEKIHVVTSKVQADPESHRAKPLPTVQSTGETGQMSSSWTVESSQSSRRTVSQKRIVRETSRESTETFVITKQITKTFEPSEFFSNDETASSIQRLRESVHSEKMRFFDGAEK